MLVVETVVRIRRAPGIRHGQIISPGFAANRRLKQEQPRQCNLVAGVTTLGSNAGNTSAFDTASLRTKASSD